VNAATFIGIDLAWRPEKNPSGVAVLKGDRRCARLLDVNASLLSVSTVLTYVEEHATASTFVAIDAPLVIRNEAGQRPCETLIGEFYGARHASCHSSNRSRHPHAAGANLAEQLIERKFRHAPDLAHPENQRVMLEVYPHPALLELFRLPGIIRYKKGNVALRRSGQQELQQWLKKLPNLTPPLESSPMLSEFLATDTNSLRGTALKAHEDGLDAIVCAYIAYHYWFWGSCGTRLFGDVDSGYIIVPIGTKTSPGSPRPR
jgi:predicted RNase H-like nuclease